MSPKWAMCSAISDLSVSIFPHSGSSSLILVLIVLPVSPVHAVYAVKFGALHFVDLFTFVGQVGEVGCYRKDFSETNRMLR
ncbi:unnamed protein product [Protopolystoma xenopodis]|uniref:Uncharacterized protein n=1 Tax=Protopolystoma xenopodis TaxID=117903 RepID=A0A448XQI3_9PLAT|nr:unnamed protein product [Protopolystoma xenopodis]